MNYRFFSYNLSILHLFCIMFRLSLLYVPAKHTKTRLRIQDMQKFLLLKIILLKKKLITLIFFWFAGKHCQHESRHLIWYIHSLHDTSLVARNRYVC